MTTPAPTPPAPVPARAPVSSKTDPARPSPLSRPAPPPGALGDLLFDPGADRQTARLVQRTAEAAPAYRRALADAAQAGHALSVHLLAMVAWRLRRAPAERLALVAAIAAQGNARRRAALACRQPDAPAGLLPALRRIVVKQGTTLLGGADYLALRRVALLPGGGEWLARPDGPGLTAIRLVARHRHVAASLIDLPPTILAWLGGRGDTRDPQTLLAACALWQEAGLPADTIRAVLAGAGRRDAAAGFADLTLRAALAQVGEPPTPVVAQADLIPITRPAEFAIWGQRLRNCWANVSHRGGFVAAGLTGRACHLIVRQRRGSWVAVRLDRHPLGWKIGEIKGHRNSEVREATRDAVEARIAAALRPGERLLPRALLPFLSLSGTGEDDWVEVHGFPF